MTNQINSPGEHPLPPSDLNQRELPIVSFVQKTIFYRVHPTQYNPVYFGRSMRGRFDAPQGEYGILYAAIDEHCAFRETIGRFSQYRLISTEVLSQRRMSDLEANRDVKLVDLTGTGLTWLEADGRLFTGSYKIAQQWSSSFYTHPSKPDGIYYRSRHDPSRTCVAVYSRKKLDFKVIKSWDLISEDYRDRLAKILNTYQYGLV
jgi:hypothetical protein